MFHRFINRILLFTFAASCSAVPVQASTLDEEMEILRLFYSDRDLQLKVTRTAIPLSATAENVTIITADDIAAINAHTVSDALTLVPGIQTDVRGGPGTVGATVIRGSDFYHVRVMMDGVTLNRLQGNYPDLEGIPVQFVDRIEIFKGIASSVWGSALGGVVNIVTKKPRADVTAGATAYLSGGERGFRDLRGESSGTSGRLGYYLYAGTLGFDGMRKASYNSVDSTGYYGKLVWNLDRGSIAATVHYTAIDQTVGIAGTVQDDSSRSRGIAAISGNYTLAQGVELEGNLHLSRMPIDMDQFLFGTAVQRHADDRSAGGSILLRHTGRSNTASLGLDFDRGLSSFTMSVNGTEMPPLRPQITKTGIFLSDTLLLGPVSLTAGARYDMQTVTKSSNLSSSFGAAWRVTPGTVLRASVGRGFSLPEVTINTDLQKATSVQAGVESTDVPGLWLRGTFFFADLCHVMNGEPKPSRQRRQGVEIEARTTPVFNTSLSGGFSFVDIENRETGKVVTGVPRYSWNIGLRYEDMSGYRGTLTGRYIWWNEKTDFYTSKYNEFVWDLNLARQFTLSNGFRPEVFLTVHNITDAAQYDVSFFRNPGRWSEGGVRFSF